MSAKFTDTVRKVLFDAAMIELSALEKQSDADHIFSPDFEKKISDITKKSPDKPRVTVPLKRRLIAAAIAIAMLISMTVTAVAFGEEIRDFIVEVYEKFTRFSVEGDNHQNGDFEEVYTFSWVPEGYALSDRSTHAPLAITAWESGDCFIQLSQSFTNTGSQTINSENAYSEIFTLENRKIYYYKIVNTSCATWIDGDYIFTIDMYTRKDDDIETIKLLIEGMYAEE